MLRCALAICVMTTAWACGSGVPYAKYEAKVDENARLREENRSLVRARGENDALKQRVAELETENRMLRGELEDSRRTPASNAPHAEPRAAAHRESSDDSVAVEETAGVIRGADIIQREQKSSGTRITVNRGTDHGVELGWTMQLVDAAGRPVPKARGKVIYVGPTYARAMMRVKARVARSCNEAILIPPQ